MKYLPHKNRQVGKIIPETETDRPLKNNNFSAKKFNDYLHRHRQYEAYLSHLVSLMERLQR